MVVVSELGGQGPLRSEGAFLEEYSHEKSVVGDKLRYALIFNMCDEL